MKKITLTILFLVSITNMLLAQVAKKIIVEHFTNTKCGICASRNPGFYTNYNNQSNALHLSVHPSLPYSTCLLYQQNAIDNDARTNYYSILGSTPRLVINGNVVPASTNYGNASIFTPYQSLTTPASLRIEQEKYGTDSMRTTVIVKTESAHSLGTLSLFVCLAEDTIFYNGGNGETIHRDVFRKALSPAVGLSFNLSQTIGDSLVYSYLTLNNPIWNFSRIYSMAILQESGSKNLVQAEAVPASYNSVTTGLFDNKDVFTVKLNPNPASTYLTLETQSFPVNFSIVDLEGRIILQEIINQEKHFIDIADLTPGIYIVQLQNQNGIVSKKMIKK
ncbi:MAG: T9SS type A sorting domain-containing protein [Bacteroidetes bacterium]|nr:T9SS type A sorting domain-containing protein [Bacteroidota bacterium]